MILHNLELSFLHHKGNTFCACFALFHQKKWPTVMVTPLANSFLQYATNYLMPSFAFTLAEMSSMLLP